MITYHLTIKDEDEVLVNQDLLTADSLIEKLGALERGFAPLLQAKERQRELANALPF